MHGRVPADEPVVRDARVASQQDGCQPVDERADVGDRDVLHARPRQRLVGIGLEEVHDLLLVAASTGRGCRRTDRVWRRNARLIAMAPEVSVGAVVAVGNTGAVGAGPEPDAGPRVTGVLGAMVDAGAGLAAEPMNGSGPLVFAGCRKISPGPLAFLSSSPLVAATMPMISVMIASNATGTIHFGREELVDPAGGPPGGPPGGPDGGPVVGPEARPADAAGRWSRRRTRG